MGVLIRHVQCTGLLACTMEGLGFCCFVWGFALECACERIGPCPICYVLARLLWGSLSRLCCKLLIILDYLFVHLSISPDVLPLPSSVNICTLSCVASPITTTLFCNLSIYLGVLIAVCVTEGVSAEAPSRWSWVHVLLQLKLCTPCCGREA